MGQKVSNIYCLVDKTMTMCESDLNKTYLEVSGASSCKCIGIDGYLHIITCWFCAMIGENRQLVTDKPVEFEMKLIEVQDCRKITNHFRGIHRIYPNLIKENQHVTIGFGNTRISTGYAQKSARSLVCVSQACHTIRATQSCLHLHPHLEIGSGLCPGCETQMQGGLPLVVYLIASFWTSSTMIGDFL